MTEDLAHAWFVDTFTVKKSFSKKLMELASLQQKDDERFATFEIRTRTLLKEILSSGMTEEELLLDLLKDRVRDRRLRDTLLTKPDIKMEEAKGLAKIFEENVETRHSTEDVYVVEHKNYASVVRGKAVEYPTQRYQQPERNEQQRVTRYEDRKQNFPTRTNEGFQRQEIVRRPTPTIALKDIAKKLYDTNRGLKPQLPKQLAPGDCFCCGNRGHMRHECPLKGKCLLCGKDNHNFRQCHLLMRREIKQQNYRVSCVQEDEENVRNNNDFDENTYDGTDNINYDGNYQDLEGRKNSNDPIGTISLVGSRD